METISYNNKKEAGRMLRGVNAAYKGRHARVIGMGQQPHIRPAYDPKLGTPNILNYKEMVRKMNR
jgi:hypothetical protein